jgi:hypothetical protein
MVSPKQYKNIGNIATMTAFSILVARMIYLMSF